jgi:hypothetical protein
MAPVIFPGKNRMTMIQSVIMARIYFNYNKPADTPVVI